MEKQLLQLLDYKLEINDFETIVTDVVQLHFQEHERKRSSSSQLLEQLDWYPRVHNNDDSAYSSNTSSFYLSSTPISPRNNNSTPPLISFD
jgi:hypothetical protein